KNSLPDLDAIFGLLVELITRLDVEGFVPHVHVHRRPDGSVFGRRMWIRNDQLCFRIRQRVASPHLCPRKEESLIGSVTIYLLLLFPLIRHLECFVSCIQTAKITDVLTKCKFTIHVNGIEYGVPIILFL